MRTLLASGLAVILSVGLFQAASAQQNPAQPDGEAIREALIGEAAVERPPVVLVRPDGDKPSRPIQLTKVDVDVTIAAHVARTSVTMTFRNDLDRAMEGNLVFPLPAGSTVSGYALDIDGKLRDAVPVEKNQARIIFETEQRYGIDPGLVEWVKGNTFSTRVWPIPAKGERTIRVDYMSDLRAAGTGRVGYLLPLRYPDKLEALSVSVDVVGERDVLTLGDPWLTVAETESGRRIVGRITNEKPSEDLAVTLPAATGKTYVGKRTGTDEAFFVVHDQLVAPVGVNIAVRRPNQIGLYWDISLSRAGADKASELKLIERLLKKMGDVSVDVVQFNTAMKPRRTFDIKGGDATKLIAYLKEARYDGATKFENLIIPTDNHGWYSQDLMERARLRPPVAYDLHLMFTDGMDNLGDPTPESIHPTRRAQAPDRQPPLFVFSGSVNANAPLLRDVSERRGGAYFDLRDHVGDKAITPIVNAVSGTPALMLRLFKVEYDDTQVTDVYPNRPTPTSGPIAVAGKLLADEATVKLHFGLAPGATIVREYTLKRSHATDDGLVPRLWAQKKVDALLGDPRGNKAELELLGQEFGIVTPGTSLLVLETIEQYVRHEIAPPRSLPKMFDQWQKQMTKREQTVAKTEQEKINQVVAMWNERVKWWDTKFEYPEGFNWVENIRKDRLDEIDGQIARYTRNLGELRGQIGDAEGERREELQGQIDQVTERQKRLAAVRKALADASNDQLTELLSDGGGRENADAEGSVELLRSVVTDLAAEEDASFEGRVTGARAQLQALSVTRDAQDAPAAAAPDAGNAALFGAAGGEVEKKAEADGDKAAPATIGLKPWDPKTPYMAAIKKVAPDKAYDAYFEQRAKHGSAPAFYIDVADYLLRNGQTEAGLSVITSVLELGIEDVRLIRIVARRLQQAGAYDDAIDLFERARELRPEEPQSYRDLALALEARADHRLVKSKGHSDAQLAIYSDYSSAIDLLNEVVVGDWDGRFERIEVIAVMEANRIIGRMMSLDIKVKRGPLPLDTRLRKLLDVDARIVMGWDTDLTDIDLWVVEPSGEKCYYSHNRTTIGGAMTRDFTQGYGPEVYNIRKAMPGKYTIKANYYGTSQANLTGGTTIQLTLITNFCRADEKREAITVRVTQKEEIVDIGQITIGE